MLYRLSLGNFQNFRTRNTLWALCMYWKLNMFAWLFIHCDKYSVFFQACLNAFAVNVLCWFPKYDTRIYANKINFSRIDNANKKEHLFCGVDQVSANVIQLFMLVFICYYYFLIRIRYLGIAKLLGLKISTLQINTLIRFF